jgi:hypothetical protein
VEFRQRPKVQQSQQHQQSGDQQQRSLAGPAPRLGSREFRRARGAALLDSVARLDASLDEAVRRQLADDIAAGYVNDHGGAVPLGFLAKCHLGPPYVDHRLSLLESILEHYAPSDHVPPLFADARPLIRSGAYLYVEIYSNGQLVPVRLDGTPVTS